jgi:hypothetical protein
MVRFYWIPIKFSCSDVMLHHFPDNHAPVDEPHHEQDNAGKMFHAEQGYFAELSVAPRSAEA